MRSPRTSTKQFYRLPLSLSRTSTPLLTTASYIPALHHATSYPTSCPRRGEVYWARWTKATLRNDVPRVSCNVNKPSHPTDHHSNESVGRRRAVPETGSFGKSTRRSRSRTGTPAAKAPDPTIAAGDAIFSAYLAQHATPDVTPRKPTMSMPISQPNLSLNPLAQIDSNATLAPRYIHREPTEVILRGFKSGHQYAAIREYERIGGRICEDYDRDPPIDQRRYKADLRDPTTLRRHTLTAEEKKKANKFAGGEHWIKITFESAEAADAAIENSPQTIQGYIVSAESYRGVPPTVDEAVPVGSRHGTPRSATYHGVRASGYGSPIARRPSATLPRSHTTPSIHRVPSSTTSTSPEGSQFSSQTLDTDTLSTVTASSGTVTGPARASPTQPADVGSCRLRGAKPMVLLDAELALLPQRSLFQRVLARMPLVNWLSSDIIGTQVPRNEMTGEFDWTIATWYWKLVWFIDSWLGIFGVADLGKEKDD